MPAKKEPKWKKEKCPVCEYQSEDAYCSECERGDQYTPKIVENGDMPAGEPTESPVEVTISADNAEPTIIEVDKIVNVEEAQVIEGEKIAQYKAPVTQYDLEMKPRPKVTSEYVEKEPAKILHANGFIISTTDKGLETAITRKKKETTTERYAKLMMWIQAKMKPAGVAQLGEWDQAFVSFFENLKERVQ